MMLSFNVEECKVMHLGQRNQQPVYSLNNTPLEMITQKRDLDIIMTVNLIPSAHVSKIAAKANSRIGLMRRNFTFIGRDRIASLPLTRPAYLGLLCPCLVFVSTPRYRVHIKIQRWATKIILELIQLQYEERFRSLDLLSLEDRRVRRDMVQTHNIPRF